jgi:hypothetical protein
MLSLEARPKLQVTISPLLYATNIIPAAKAAAIMKSLAEREGQVSNLFNKDLIKIGEFIVKYGLKNTK